MSNKIVIDEVRGYTISPFKFYELVNKVNDNLSILAVSGGGLKPAISSISDIRINIGVTTTVTLQTTNTDVDTSVNPVSGIIFSVVDTSDNEMTIEITATVDIDFNLELVNGNKISNPLPVSVLDAFIFNTWGLYDVSLGTPVDGELISGDPSAYGNLAALDDSAIIPTNTVAKISVTINSSNQVASFGLVDETILPITSYDFDYYVRTSKNGFMIVGDLSNSISSTYVIGDVFDISKDVSGVITILKNNILIYTSPTIVNTTLRAYFDNFRNINFINIYQEMEI